MNALLRHIGRFFVLLCVVSSMRQSEARVDSEVSFYLEMCGADDRCQRQYFFAVKHSVGDVVKNCQKAQEQVLDSSNGDVKEANFTQSTYERTRGREMDLRTTVTLNKPVSIEEAERLLRSNGFSNNVQEKKQEEQGK